MIGVIEKWRSSENLITRGTFYTTRSHLSCLTSNGRILDRNGGLFIEPAGKKLLTGFDGAFTGEAVDYPALAGDNKRQVLKNLLDFATVHTCVNGGRVYALKPEKMTDEILMAAVSRY